MSKAWGHYSGELLNCRVVCELWLDLQGEFLWMVNVDELQMLYRYNEQGKQ